MFCLSCSKLAILAIEKVCLKCKGIIYNSISCICNNCSEQEKICSCCLKKTINTLNNNGKIFGGCGSCGKK